MEFEYFYVDFISRFAREKQKQQQKNTNHKFYAISSAKLFLINSAAYTGSLFWAE